MFKAVQRALCAMLLAGVMPPLAMAAQAPLVFAVSTGNSMPMLELSKNRPQRGILNDVALALSTQLDRQPRFAVLPRKRIEDALLRGNVDIYCYTSPQWLSIDVQWSAPLLHNYDVITTRADTPVPASVAELKNKPLGTVLGYVYPHLEQQLDTAFVRDDGLSQEHAIKKLLARRYDYLIMSELDYLYQRNQAQWGNQLNSRVLRFSRYHNYCALSRKSSLNLAELNTAIAQLKKHNRFAEIQRRYD